MPRVQRGLTRRASQMLTSPSSALVANDVERSGHHCNKGPYMQRSERPHVYSQTQDIPHVCPPFRALHPSLNPPSICLHTWTPHFLTIPGS